ncbi:MAG: DEAD/DEAH box helicase [Planctomycetes bacterium]|nr:DEAD/DEAH box helicase [Planctomycetota bacterium]
MTEQLDEQSRSFDELGLDETLLRAVGKMHWTEPSEIQAKLIPVALTGRDVMGQARTGTGKTGAFALPVLQRMTAGEGVRCLVLTPTRELAAQVARDFRELARYTDHKITVAYGGTRVRQQAVELKQHPAIVVGTPGRVMDLMKRKLLHLDTIRFAILDEVDRMLDIGFRDDIRRILGSITCEHQTIFVSATIDAEINRLARQYMKDPAEVFLAPDKLTVEEVEQFYIPVQPHDKRRLLVALLKQEKAELAIVFTRTKREADRVAAHLIKAGVNAKEIHGDLYQSKRDKVLKQFRDGKINVLVATDLASRGLDIDDITHIVNYDPPDEVEVYVHRVGRTARMGAAGKAFTLVTPEEGGILTEIEKLINREILPASVEGFQASEKPQPQAREPQPAAALSRLNAPLYEGADTSARPLRRTLGSKFPPRRRRRL